MVAIAFGLKAGGASVSGLVPITNSGGSQLQSKFDEARLYINSVRLVTKGERIPVALYHKDLQFANIALSYFKDACGDNLPCSEKAPDKNTVVTGSLPAGTNVALEFTVGVPAQANVNGSLVSLNRSNRESAAAARHCRDELELAGWSPVFVHRHRSGWRHHAPGWFESAHKVCPSWPDRMPRQSSNRRVRVLYTAQSFHSNFGPR